MLAKLRSLKPDVYPLFIEGAFLILAAQAVLALVPFKNLAPRVGRLVRLPSPIELDARQKNGATRIGWAIRAIARRTPWTTKCLVQALAAKWMLNRRRIPGTLFLGVAEAKEVGKIIDAHAWVCSGDVFLTGESGHERYAVLGMFE